MYEQPIKPENYFCHSRPELLSLVNFSYSKVLEVGCGDGTFSKQLDKANEIWGIEPNVSAALKAKEHMTKVFSGTYEQSYSEIPNDYFDLIVCNDVIEHMLDHEKFFRLIKDKLQKNGVLIGSVPNVRYYPNLINLLFHKNWKYENEGVLDRTHLRFFTEKSLLSCLHEQGYNQIKIFLINPIKLDNNLWGIKHKIILQIARFISLGSWYDLPYLQIAFKVTL